MDFWFERSTPANTAEANSLKTDMKMVPGIIHKIWILHPPGCHGLAYARIYHNEHPLFPTNPENAYHGDTFPMEFDEYYELKDPALLTLKTWNLDDAYNHNVFVRVSILPEEQVSPLILLKDMVSIFKRLLGLRV